ncbi:MAG: restriction endonuclease [Arenimonas sp.]
MSGALFAVVIAMVGVGASYWYFGMHRRRQAETEAGVHALANMKWRECVGLVLESLHSDGYQEEHSTRQPGDGGTEFLLKRDGENVLLSYKHGTAYRIGEANVRDFANGVQLQGAQTGILITLGQAEASAHELARKYGVKLIEGTALWPRVERYVSPNVLASVRRDASGGTSKGLWIGSVASIALGACAWLLGPADAPAKVAAVKAPAPVVAALKVETEEERATARINATARAMAEVASLTDEQRLQRRAESVAKVGAITQIKTAGWSTQSTLVLSLNHTDGKDRQLVDEVCRTLTQYEELRYTRVQLEPPMDSTVPVRWKQCQ